MMAGLPFQLLVLLLVAATSRAINFECARVRTDGVDFDLSKLGGPRSVSWVQEEAPSISNTTFTLDICQQLKKDSTLADGEQCENGSRVCAVQRTFNTVENTTNVFRVIAIAGDFTTSHGRALDPRVTRLKNSASHSDSETEGLTVELNGGKYPEDRTGKPQRAIIRFECDKDRTGNEMAMVPPLEERDEEGDGQEGDKKPEVTPSLTFVSYKAEDEIDVLRLTWKTKYACEDVPTDDDEEGDEPESAGWGFFGWLFIIVFLGAAAYLIFGSWLNYTRYGARGWDLVPHGDAIRDLPYIVADWGRTAVNTVQGRSHASRGGYSAV